MWALALVAGLSPAATLRAQTVADAYGKGASLWAGADYSNMQAGFPNGSTVRIMGVGAFVDYCRTSSIGFEAHMRFLNFDSWNGETQQDYLAGPRYTFLHSDRWRPFASFQIGAVRIQYPFSIGTGTSFALAPGGGLEYRLRPKWAARAGYEYQFLPNSPNFTNEPKFGIRPNGFQIGISYKIF